MPLPEVSKYYFSAAEFERMGEAGVFTKDARLELIEGEIIETSPAGSRPAACVNFLSRFLNRTGGDIGARQHTKPNPPQRLLRA